VHFSQHHLALSLEKRVGEPIRPNATGSDHGKYAVSMDGNFAFRSRKVVEIDFTWGAVTTPSDLQHTKLGNP
jgi:hypothetical protein